ncbi:MAG TPA: hypothetical protein PKE66_17450 [Pyrinomonadaceae bacterium]|nr:hypothetical protein [Pyrinomonadaceae bacterium]
MNQVELETRVRVLEKELDTLKSKFRNIEEAKPWWKGRIGIFANDKDHAEAMKLGENWRKNGENEE